MAEETSLTGEQSSALCPPSDSEVQTRKVQANASGGQKAVNTDKSREAVKFKSKPGRPKKLVYSTAGGFLHAEKVEDLVPVPVPTTPTGPELAQAYTPVTKPKRRRGRSFLRKKPGRKRQVLIPLDRKIRQGQKTGHPIGGPTKEIRELRERLRTEAREARKKYKSSLPKLGPPKPVGIGWGGARKGAGRKPFEPGKKKQPIVMAVLDMSSHLGTRLKNLEPVARREYIRRAIDLMTDIQPPEKFSLASKEETSEPGGAD